MPALAIYFYFEDKTKGFVFIPNVQVQAVCSAEIPLQLKLHISLTWIFIPNSMAVEFDQWVGARLSTFVAYPFALQKPSSGHSRGGSSVACRI